MATKKSARAVGQAAANRTLSNARRSKQDEFYTQLSDVSNELKHYKQQLKGKKVLCNCDDPFESNFFKYFALNFKALGLGKLVATSYRPSPIAGLNLPTKSIKGLKPRGREPYAIEIKKVPDRDGDGVSDLADVEFLLKNDANSARTLVGDGDYSGGDFRSAECKKLLKEADVVITNPPFSLFREYVAQLVASKKKFLIIGSQSAITYKEIFKLIKEDNLWLGVDNGGTKWFRVPDDYDIETESRKRIENGVKYFSMGSIMWFTNMDNPRRHEAITLYKQYSPQEYPKYDNYDAIEVGKVAEIPANYEGVMGVPITFLGKYNSEQFEIVGLAAGNIKGLAGIPSITGKDGPYINGKLRYGRIFIRRKNV